MKTHQNQNRFKSKFHKILLLSLTLLLASCDSEVPAAAQDKGRLYAKSLGHEVHNKYFSYFTLGTKDKELCYEALNKAYIDRSRQDDVEYIKGFIEEIEKLGFKHFLDARGLPCEVVNQNPKFIEDKEAYLITCNTKDKNNYQQKYLVRFNNTTKEWQIVIEDNNAKEASHD